MLNLPDLPIKSGQRSLGVRFTVAPVVLLLVSLMVGGGVLSPEGEHGITTFHPVVGWRDDFVYTDNVSASSGVVFNGLDVQLPLSSGASRQGVVLPPSPGDWDGELVVVWGVMFDEGVYRLWYGGGSGGGSHGGYATSTDGRQWTKHGIVIAATLPEEGGRIQYGEVIRIGADYWAYYAGWDGITFRIFAATSRDGISWTKHGIVLNPGPPGAEDDGFVWRPTVVFSAGTFYMWYSGNRASNTMRNSIFLATSTDGLTWTRQGLVLRPGLTGAPDSANVAMPSVRLIAGNYVMAYAGFDGIKERLFLAESKDGRVWETRGLLLDTSAGEDPRVTHPALLLESASSFSVYYASNYPIWSVFLATGAKVPPAIGWVRSTPVAIPNDMAWLWFNQSATVPLQTSLTVTVRDGVTLEPIAQLRNTTAGAVNLSAVSPTVHATLVFEAWFHGSGVSTPILDSWEVSWRPRPVTVSPLAYWWVFAIAGAAAIAFGVLLLWIHGGRRTPPVPPPPQT